MAPEQASAGSSVCQLKTGMQPRAALRSAPCLCRLPLSSALPDELCPLPSPGRQLCHLTLKGPFDPAWLPLSVRWPGNAPGGTAGAVVGFHLMISQFSKISVSFCLMASVCIPAVQVASALSLLLLLSLLLSCFYTLRSLLFW